VGFEIQEYAKRTARELWTTNYYIT